jgi:septum formation protein
VDTARKCLELLSGRRHVVLGAVSILSPQGKEKLFVEKTTVQFKRLTPQDIKWYLDTKEWEGKAGGYAIQGKAAIFIPAINGCYFTVVGLPLSKTIAALRHMGML